MPKNKMIIITVQGIVNILLVGLFAYLFVYTSKGQIILNKAKIHPHTLSWNNEVEKHLLYSTNKNKQSIVMLGNSITYECEWNELLKRPDVINRGIPGDMVKSMLNRSQDLLLGPRNTVVLMAGINDILYGNEPTAFINDYYNLILFLAKTSKPIVMSTLYTANNINANKRVDELNELIKHFCNEQGILWIDLNKHLATNNKLRLYYTYDGVHLNGPAYTIWANLIMPHLPPVNLE